MKRYRAVVIDGKRIVRCGVMVLLGATVAGLLAASLNLSKPQLPSWDFVAERTLEESIPALNTVSGDDSRVLSRVRKGGLNLLGLLVGFDVTDPKTAVFGEFPVVRAVSGGYLAGRVNQETIMAYNPENADTARVQPEPERPDSGKFPIKAVDSGQVKAVGKGKILIRNETNYGISVEKMLNEPLKFDMKGEGAKVLIVHTHATESYAEEGASSYDSGKSDRNLDCDKNVVRVGQEMKRIFEEKGIKVIHDTTLHDHPNFNGSYENSRKTVEKHLSENPGICIVLDVHRDAFVYEDGSKAKFVTEEGGKSVAQLMLVVGTDAGGLNHPNWRENMKLALKFQDAVSKKNPTLMRGVNLRKERFNGHTTYGSMIIEVGSSGNTLNEALNGAGLAASAMADFLNTLK